MNDNATDFEMFRKRAYFLTFLVLSILFVLKYPRLVLVFFASVLMAVDLRGMTNWTSRRLDVFPVLAARDRLRYALSVIIVLLGVLGGMVGLGFMVGLPFIDRLDELTTSVLDGWQSLRQTLEKSAAGRRFLNSAPSAEVLVNKLSGKVYSAFSGMVGALTGIGVILIISFYLAISAESYVNGILAITVPKKKARMQEILDTTAHALRYWTIGRLTSMVATGILTGVGLWIIGVPLPMSLGIIVGVFSFVPIVGTLLGALPGVLMGLTQSLEMGVYASMVYIVVQILEGNLITPLVQHRTISLPPVVLLASQTLAGAFAGILGIVFATPAAVVVMIIVQMAFVKDALGNPITPLGQPVSQSVIEQKRD